MNFAKHKINPNKELQAYIIGLAIGDGNLSNPNGRAVRLRITCDKKYPILIQRISNSLRSLFPNNKVGLVNRKGCVDVSVYSNKLENLLGWSACDGSKYIQNVSIPNWINESDNYKINCLKGLIETDGSIYNDRKYKTVMFSTIIPILAQEVNNMIISLGFKPHYYKDNKNNRKTIYKIRISKDVEQFINLIKPEKI